MVEIPDYFSSRGRELSMISSFQAETSYIKGFALNPGSVFAVNMKLVSYILTGLYFALLEIFRVIMCLHSSCANYLYLNCLIS